MIKAQGFHATAPDNDRTLVFNLENILRGIDPQLVIDVRRQPTSIIFVISPSDEKFFAVLLEEISTFFSIFGIKLSYSKSMKISKNIKFSINQ